ncbi:MAG: hypothetical protein MRY83_14055 [Flavobacteriales bacterium]|nr:hypothetical protein [Flavobacteriales bacterium]
MKICLLLSILMFNIIGFTQSYDGLLVPSITKKEYRFEIEKKKSPKIFISCSLCNSSEKDLIITRPYWRLNPYQIRIDSTISPLNIGILHTTGYSIDTLRLASKDSVEFDLHLIMNLTSLEGELRPGKHTVSFRYDYDPGKMKSYLKYASERNSLPSELEDLVDSIDQVNSKWSNAVTIIITDERRKKRKSN